MAARRPTPRSPANQSMWKIRWRVLIAVSAGHEYVVGLAHVWQRGTGIEVTGIISYWNPVEWGISDEGQNAPLSPSASRYLPAINSCKLSAPLTNHILTISLLSLLRCIPTIIKPAKHGDLLTRNVHATLSHVEHGDQYVDRSPSGPFSASTLCMPR